MAGSSPEKEHIQSINSIQQLLDEIASAKGKEGEQLWFRGHSKSGWPLLPKVLRDLDNEGNQVFHDHKQEVSLCVEFMNGAPVRRDNCPGSKDYIGWLCLMQHHGLPTRLLDWTTSALVGLFFAVEQTQDLEVNGELCVLWPTRLADLRQFRDRGIVQSMHSSNPDVRDIVSPAFNFNAEDRPWVIPVVPPHVDLRMLLQQAAFTIHGRIGKRGRMLLPDSPKDNSHRRIIQRLLIPAAGKRRLIGQLDDLGIRRSTLFPDLSFLAIDKAERAIPRTLKRHKRARERGNQQREPKRRL